MPNPLLLQIGMHAGRGGGVDRYFDGLLYTLPSLYPDVMGLVFGEPATDVPPHVHIIGSPHAPLRERLVAIRHQLRRIVDQNPDRTIICVNHFSLYGLPALLPKKSKQVQLVSHFHGPWAMESAAEGASRFSVLTKQWIERLVLSRSQVVVADSSAFRDLAVERYRLSHSRCTYTWAGTETAALYAASAVDKQIARQKMAWPADRKIIFCVRRLAHRMGLDQLIDAFAKVHERHPEWMLVIGGKGRIESQLREQIAAHSMQDHIQLPGFIRDEDLPLAYRAADFTVVPSVSLEGFGLVILESLATGTPVLVTPIGGMPEIMRPLASQCIIEGSSVSDLTEGLDAAMHGRTQFPLPQQCVQYVKDNFEWPDVARRLLQVYGLS